MNILLWILQAVLAIHTAMGGVWKFSHSVEQTMPSLKAIPNGVWLGMGVIEIILSLALILPAFYKPLAIWVPVAAVCIAAEMLIFSGMHIFSDEATYSPIIYWLVVAGICAFTAYGRFVLKPF